MIGHVKIIDTATSPVGVLPRAVLERVTIAGTDNEALYIARCFKFATRINPDPFDGKKSTEIKNECLILQRAIVSSPIAMSARPAR